MERKLDLNNYGLVEMNAVEMQETAGGLSKFWSVVIKVAVAVAGAVVGALVK